jgi:hypothetical protein
LIFKIWNFYYVTSSDCQFFISVVCLSVCLSALSVSSLFLYVCTVCQFFISVVCLSVCLSVFLSVCVFQIVFSVVNQTSFFLMTTIGIKTRESLNGFCCGEDWSRCDTKLTFVNATYTHALHTLSYTHYSHSHTLSHTHTDRTHVPS